MKELVLFFSLINVFTTHSNAQDAVVAAEKMNVFYMGVDNPISIAVPNVSSDKLKVTGENVESINKQSDGHYIVRVARPGETTIIIEANGQITKKKFRAKSIPDPIPLIAGVRSGCVVGGKENLRNFIHADALIAKIENFDFDARCSVQSFEIIISPQKGEIFKKTILGPVFSEDIKKRFQTLQVGDTVTFLEIKSRCPGDEIARNLGSLTYAMQ
jgi:GldM C-terminal domain